MPELIDRRRRKTGMMALHRQGHLILEVGLGSGSVLGLGLGFGRHLHEITQRHHTACRSLLIQRMSFYEQCRVLIRKVHAMPRKHLPLYAQLRLRIGGSRP